MSGDSITSASEQVANSELLSAAPDLLEALKEFMSMWNSGDSNKSSKRAQVRLDATGDGGWSAWETRPEAQDALESDHEYHGGAAVVVRYVRERAGEKEEAHELSIDFEQRYPIIEERDKRIAELERMLSCGHPANGNEVGESCIRCTYRELSKDQDERISELERQLAEAREELAGRDELAEFGKACFTRMQALDVARKEPTNLVSVESREEMLERIADENSEAEFPGGFN